MHSWIQAIRDVSASISQTPDEPIDNEPVKPTAEGALPSPTHEGFLLKEGHNIVKDWKRRWFTLCDDRLVYYNKKSVRSSDKFQC